MDLDVMQSILIEKNEHIYYLIAAYSIAFIVLTILGMATRYQLKHTRRKYAQLMEK